MNKDEARQIAREKIEQLGAELERGQSDTLRTYLAAMAKFPRYSVNNTLLILAQRPSTTTLQGLDKGGRRDQDSCGLSENTGGSWHGCRHDSEDQTGFDHLPARV